MNESTKNNFGGKKLLPVLLALFLAVAVVSEKASASFVFSDGSDKKSQKKKDEKKKSKSSPVSDAPAVSAEGLEAIHATVETDPVPSGGDAADDPAIWIHPTDPVLSTIIGTNKQGGLAVYDLGGKQIQYLADGRMDNVDL
ncbi:MAG: phytase, partial [Blastocatellia bacterium]